MTLPQLPLNNGLAIPAIGLGTWKADRDDVARAVFTAITVGYRHIDCAAIYNNEREVGEALQRALQQRLVQRQQLWITSKLWNNAHLPQHVQPAAERSIKELGLDYLDLFLIHWPVSFRQDIVFPKKPDQYLPPDENRLLDTWRAMEKLVRKGLVRAIGVSNFTKSRFLSCRLLPSLQHRPESARRSFSLPGDWHGEPASFQNQRKRNDLKRILPQQIYLLPRRSADSLIPLITGDA